MDKAGGRWLHFLVLLLHCIVSSGYKWRGESGGGHVSGTDASRLISFNIAHYNDIHSHLYPADVSMSECNPDKGFALCYGGYARLATVLERIRSTGPTLLLDAGDEFTGSVFSYVYRGAEAYPLQNMLGITAMTLGNHEFDYGPDVLLSYLSNVTFPIVTCNVVPSPNSVLYPILRPGPLIVRVPQPGGRSVRVGIVGWTTLDTIVSASPGPDVAVLPLVPSVRACVRQLEREGVKIIIGVGHAGIGEGGDLDVAAQVPGLDLVVGGHSHSFLFSAPHGPLLVASDPTSFDIPVLPAYPFWVPVDYHPAHKVPYVQAFFGGRYLGNLSLLFNPSGSLVSLSGSPILLGGAASSNSVRGNATFSAAIASLYAPLNHTFSRVIGSSDRELVAVADTAMVVRLRETNLGDLVADAMLWEINRNAAFVSEFGAAPIALLNGGGIRASLPAGNITLGHLLTSFPFGSVLQVKSLTGKQLLATLARSADAYSRLAPFGGFLQVAGVYLAFDPTKAARSRVIQMGVLNSTSPSSPPCLTAIEPSSSYLVITCDFLGQGGDNYTDMAAAATVLEAGRVLADVVGDYIALNSPLHPPAGGAGRIYVGPPQKANVPEACPPEDSLVSGGESERMVKGLQRSSNPMPRGVRDMR